MNQKERMLANLPYKAWMGLAKSDWKTKRGFSSTTIWIQATQLERTN